MMNAEGLYLQMDDHSAWLDICRSSITPKRSNFDATLHRREGSKLLMAVYEVLLTVQAELPPHIACTLQLDFPGALRMKSVDCW